VFLGERTPSPKKKTTMAYRYFFVSISNLELAPIKSCDDDPSETATLFKNNGGDKYRVFVDFDGFKTDVMDPPQTFPCAWRGLNMSFVYSTSEVNAMNEKTLMLVCRAHRTLLSDRDMGRVEIDLHTLMTGPSNVERKIMTEPSEFELDLSDSSSSSNDDDDDDDDNDGDGDVHTRRRRRHKFQPQELCLVRCHIVIRQLSTEIQFGLDQLNITPVVRRLQQLESQATRPVTLRIEAGYADPDVVQWSHAPQIVDFEKVRRRLLAKAGSSVYAQNILIYLPQRVPVTNFVRGTINVVLTVETATGGEYEAGRMVIAVLGNYDFFQPRITLSQRVIWSDTVLDELNQFQMVLQDTCKAIFSVSNGPVAIQMSRGRLTEHGVRGSSYIGFPTPEIKHLDPRAQLRATYNVHDTMRTIWDQYLKDKSYSQAPEWLFKCRPNPILAERGHLLPTDNDNDNDNGEEEEEEEDEKEKNKEEEKDKVASSMHTKQGQMTIEAVPTHLTIETYLQQLIRFFRQVESEWSARDLVLRQQYAATPSHAIARMHTTERAQADQQMYWLRIQVEHFLDTLAQQQQQQQQQKLHK